MLPYMVGRLCFCRDAAISWSVTKVILAEFALAKVKGGLGSQLLSPSIKWRERDCTEVAIFILDK